MKTNNYEKSSNKHLIISLIVVGLVLLGLATYFIVVSKSTNNQSLPVNSPTTNTQTPANIDTNKPDSASPATDDSVKSNTNSTDNSTAPEDTTIVITSSKQNGSVYQIRTLISVVASSGNCTLTITRDSKTVTRTSGVQAGPSSSTCQGFDIPIDELSPGDWNIVVDFSNTKHQAKVSQIITIK